jgi:hypothetical protein
MRLRTHAFQIMESRRHVLRRFQPGDDETVVETGIAERDAPLDEIQEELGPEQLSLFSVLSAVATGMQIHAITPSGVAIPFEMGTDELDLPEATHYDDESEFADLDGDADLDLDLADIPTDAGWAPQSGRSVFEIKAALRESNANLAKRLVDITGWSHARVNGEMNRLGAVAAVSSATTDQLERRLRKSEEWLAQLRRRRS